MNEPITYEWLRSRGFRFHSTNASNVPHMVRVTDSRMDTALEIGEAIGGGWTVWLRSDIAHSRCRFCFLRHIDTQKQLESLWFGITDRHLVLEAYDPEQFAESLERCKEEAQRHYLEYAKHNLRYGYVPG